MASLTNRTLTEIEEYVGSKDASELKNQDSASTRIMKALGYDGIDVRGMDALDNMTYGSVIYDVKSQVDQEHVGEVVVADEAKKEVVPGVETKKAVTKPETKKEQKKVVETIEGEVDDSESRGYRPGEDAEDVLDSGDEAGVGGSGAVARRTKGTDDSSDGSREGEGTKADTRDESKDVRPPSVQQGRSGTEGESTGVYAPDTEVTKDRGREGAADGTDDSA